MVNIFCRKKSKERLVDDIDRPPPTTPETPESNSILDGNKTIHYTVRDPWQWVIQDIADGHPNIIEVDNPSELPSKKLAGSATTAVTQTTPRRRRKKARQPCTLRVEVRDNNSDKLMPVHGSSEAFDGLEDKDELVRTIQRCRCEHLELSPPSKLLNWDVTREECMNLVGRSLPGLLSNNGKGRVAVLKEPMGSRGTGVFFVKNAVEIHEIIEEHRKRAVDEPEFLDNLIAMKGRIPSWVLQAEVTPCLLVRGGHKFHIRAYVALLEQIESEEELFDVFVYNRHEVRIASDPVPAEETESRNREAHITNGAMSDSTERVLLQDIPELVDRNLHNKVEVFVAQTFGKHFVPDMERRISVSANQEEATNPPKKFAMAALDIMVTHDGRLYLLEVNVNPAAPPRETLSENFKTHLVGFMTDLMNLVAGYPSPNFHSSHKILQQK